MRTPTGDTGTFHFTMTYFGFQGSGLLIALLAFISFVASFDTDFEINSLELDAPFQVDPNCTANSTLSCEYLYCANQDLWKC